MFAGAVALVKQIHRKWHDLRGTDVLAEKISAKEHKELDNIFKEMQRGTATPWRDAN